METGEAASQSGSSPENPRLPQTTASVESPGSVSGSKRPTAASAKNQRACDGCRARKVRCLYGSGEQRCQGCIFLDIACTHLRPRRRRGPQNKHAHNAIHEERTQLPLAPSHQSPEHGPPQAPAGIIGSGSGSEAASSPQLLRMASAVSPMPQQSHWLSLFAPEPTILRILNDWFERVHALAPVLVRGRFMRRFRSREADHNATFCGLVISVCMATCATLRREDYGDATAEKGATFIQYHRLLEVDSSGQNAYTLDWCVAMYNLGMSASSLATGGLKSTSSYHALSMAAIGVRYIAYYCMKDHDFVEQQQAKRLFMLIFAGSQSGDAFGMLTPNIASYQDNWPQLRPLPLTDDELDPTGKDLDPLAAEDTAWHGNNTSYIPGLLRLSDIFWVWHEAQTIPAAMLGGAEAALARYLAQVQQVIDSLPPELRWRGGLSRPAHVTEGHDAQVVNIFITSLHIRSNLLEKFGSTSGSHEEHQRIVDDLLEILYHLPQAVFDANGSSLVPKIRDIGASYLEQAQKIQGMGDDVKEKMERLSRRLHDLDCWPGHPTGY